MPVLVQNLSKLETLSISLTGIANIADVDQVCMLENLKKLVLDAACLSDDKLGKIFNECKSLKQFQCEGENKGTILKMLKKVVLVGKKCGPNLNLHIFTKKVKPRFFHKNRINHTVKPRILTRD